MSRSKKLSMRRIRRYLKNREGTAAIEFAILAVPFFMLIFAVLELAIVFFINSTLNHAVSERQIRTGNFQACGTQAQFKQLVCANMSGLGNCEKRLRIDVVSDSSFGAITLAEPPEPPEPDPSDPAATDDIPNGDWENTAASVPVVVRGLYYHKLVLPPQLTRLETMEGKAFRNEPFPAPGACPVT
jgi:Flp pilus assembly pilin Flp